MRSPTLPCGSTAAVPPRHVFCCSAQSSRERVVPVQLERVLQASLASCAAVALMIGPAGAISGGKQSMGIFKPLDDADLSGVALTYQCCSYAVSPHVPQVQPAIAKQQQQQQRIYQQMSLQACE